MSPKDIVESEDDLVVDDSCCFGAYRLENTSIGATLEQLPPKEELLVESFRESVEGRLRLCVLVELPELIVSSAVTDEAVLMPEEKESNED